MSVSSSRKLPLSRISHMIILTDIEQFDSKTNQLSEQSFNQTHRK